MAHAHESQLPPDVHAELADRTNHGTELYKAVFGKNVDRARVVADIGAGDSPYAEDTSSYGRRVIRIDAQYDTVVPSGGDYIAAHAQDIPLPDQCIDSTISAFMMQHIPHGNGEVAKAITEMVRITKERDPANESVGYTYIYPVWRPDKLRSILRKRFPDMAGLGYPDREALERQLARYDKQTLVIARNPGMDEARLHELATAVEDSKALKRPHGPRNTARRALVAMGLRSPTAKLKLAR